jgi:hypothetical protein
MRRRFDKTRSTFRRVHERGQHRAQQVRRRGQLVMQEAAGSILLGAVIVVSPSEAL